MSRAIWLFWPAILALACCASARDDAGRTDEPADKPRRIAGPREMFLALGVSAGHFELLQDGRPVDAAEEETLVRFLSTQRRFDLGDQERWSRGAFVPAEQSAQPRLPRGEIFLVRGRIKQVVKVAPAGELGERFEMPHYYRCRIELGDDGGPVEVFATTIPRAWDIEQPLDERVSLLGVFLKWRQMDPAGEPVFAAQRVGWHPATVLGDLQMDVGLFDDVQNRTGFSDQDRECFYQLLAAAGRAGTNELLLRTQRGPDQPDFSVRPLFNEPDGRQGELVAFTGTARRVLEVRVSDQDAIDRFGIRSYYQIELFTADSEQNPITFCVRQLPPGMPIGPDVKVRMRMPGFFYKTWSYKQTKLDLESPTLFQLAPTLIGREPQWIQTPVTIISLARNVAAALAATAILGVWLAVWLYNRGDRKFREIASLARLAPADGKSLNELGLEADSGPDFRNWKE